MGSGFEGLTVFVEGFCVFWVWDFSVSGFRIMASEGFRVEAFRVLGFRVMTSPQMLLYVYGACANKGAVGLGAFKKLAVY